MLMRDTAIDTAQMTTRIAVVWGVTVHDLGVPP